MSKKIIIVTNGDDWEGLYLDGKLITEGHSVSPRDICNALNINMELVELSSEYLGEKISNLPKDFSKIPKKYILK